MRCPKCHGSVGRKDMVAPLAWTSFVCPNCQSHLDATKPSQTLIILAVGGLGTCITWVFDTAGLGSMISIAVGAVTLLAGIPWGMGVFAHLKLHSNPHASAS